MTAIKHIKILGDAKDHNQDFCVLEAEMIDQGYEPDPDSYDKSSLAHLNFDLKSCVRKKR